MDHKHQHQHQHQHQHHSLSVSLPHIALPDEKPAYGIAVVVGNANPELGKEICAVLKTNAADAVIGTFADGELSIQIDSNIRGTDAFIIQYLNLFK